MFYSQLEHMKDCEQTFPATPYFGLRPQIEENIQWPWNWDVTVCTLKLFKNGMLQKIYAHTRKKITG
jgi:hypothetical protein